MNISIGKRFLIPGCRATPNGGSLFERNKQMEARQISELIVRYVLTKTDEAFVVLSVPNVIQNHNIERLILFQQFKQQTIMTLKDFLSVEKIMSDPFCCERSSDIMMKQVAEKNEVPYQ